MEDDGGGSIDERMRAANREHPRTRDTKYTMDALITVPATSLSEINEHVELKMITNTMTGARNMNTVMKVSTTMENRSILVGTT